MEALGCIPRMLGLLPSHSRWMSGSSASELLLPLLNYFEDRTLIADPVSLHGDNRNPDRRRPFQQRFAIEQQRPPRLDG